MKKTHLLISLIVGLLMAGNTYAQTVEPAQKMSVSDRMAKARAAKADRKTMKLSAPFDPSVQKDAKATPADYKAPVDKVQKGPNGEAVHTGERGGKYYINKNGNKTYLSSNQ